MVLVVPVVCVRVESAYHRARAHWTIPVTHASAVESAQISSLKGAAFTALVPKDVLVNIARILCAEACNAAIARSAKTIHVFQTS